jgi:UDP-glucuronate decarboxylase
MVDGLLRLMNSPDEFTGPVNLGNPVEFTILELAQKIIAKTGSKSPIVKLPLPADDPVQRKPDITLARTVLGWNAKITLDDGLPRAIDYFRRIAAC